MVRLVEGLVAMVGLLVADASPLEVYHVDLERALSGSTDGLAARAGLQKLQSELQAEAERRELKIASLRKRSETSRSTTDRAQLERAIEEHVAATEAAQRRLGERQGQALGPMVQAARAELARRAAPGFRVVVMEDAPLVAPPKACDWAAALGESLNTKRPMALARRAECRVHFVFLLGFDEAVKASRAGVDAAQRVEELRSRLQGELDEKRRRVAALPEGERYSGELELAEQFRLNQRRLLAMEEEEEGRLFTQLTRAVERVMAEVPEARFVDAPSIDLPGVSTCAAAAWSREVLDGGAGRARLFELCGFTTPR